MSVDNGFRSHSSLYTVLKQLQAASYPVLESPHPRLRRASVAIAIRFKPAYSHWPSEGSRKIDDLDDFFEQDWVKHGDPEILFIKRAARKGEQGTAHIALPGGKREPSDADDAAAAVRESWEEVGLDLERYAIPCGNLPQRLVTAYCNKKPLWLLCPYIYLVTVHSLPPLRLQPTEVGAAHWVPIRNLLVPERRTVIFEGVANRLASDETGVRQWMLKMFPGKMVFSAIALLPTESLHSAEPDVQREQLQDTRRSRPSRHDKYPEAIQQLWRSDICNQYGSLPLDGPLLLWGTTLGAMSDFLDLLPPYNAITLWAYPNFEPLDVRAAVWLLTYRYREGKRSELEAGDSATENAVHIAAQVETFPTDTVERPDVTGLHGLGTGLTIGPRRQKKALVSTLLDGLVYVDTMRFLLPLANAARYYNIVRRAIIVALIGRVGLVVTLTTLAIMGVGVERIKGWFVQ